MMVWQINNFWFWVYQNGCGGHQIIFGLGEVLKANRPIFGLDFFLNQTGWQVVNFLFDFGL